MSPSKNISWSGPLRFRLQIIDRLILEVEDEIANPNKYAYKNYYKEQMRELGKKEPQGPETLVELKELSDAVQE